MEDNDIVRVIFLTLLGIGAVLYFIITVVIPLSFHLLIFFLIIFVICLIRDAFFRDDWEDDYWSVWALIPVGITFLVLGIAMIIGYGVGGTVIGQASLQTYTAVSGAQQQVSDSVNQAINQVVEDSCKTLSPENCESLKRYVKITRTLEEVQSYAGKLKTTTKTVQKIDNYVNPETK